MPWNQFYVRGLFCLLTLVCLSTACVGLPLIWIRQCQIFKIYNPAFLCWGFIRISQSFYHMWHHSWTLWTYCNLLLKIHCFCRRSSMASLTTLPSFQQSIILCVLPDSSAVGSKVAVITSRTELLNNTICFVFYHVFGRFRVELPGPFGFLLLQFIPWIDSHEIL